MIPQSITVEIRELERQKDKLNKNVVELEKMIKSSKVFDKFLKNTKSILFKLSGMQIMFNM